MALPLLFAPMMLAVALIQFWNRPAFALVYGGLPETGYPVLDWIQDTITRLGMPVIGYIARYLPLAVLLLYEAGRRIDEEWLEAARGLGAGGASVLRTVLLPLLRPALLGAFALLWSLCASELTISVLIYQPGGDPLVLPIFNQMHVGATAEVAVMSLVLAAMSSGILAALLLLILLLRKHDG
jgi:iron(III) transport system permease protein